VRVGNQPDRRVTPAMPLRILVTAPSMEIVGGQSVQALRLLEALKQRNGVAVEFQPINPALPGVFAALQRVKYLRTVVTEAAYVFQLIRRIPRCDAVHSFSAGYWSFLLAAAPPLVLGKLFRKKTILNYHDGRADDHLLKFPNSVRLMKIADRIVTPSRFLVEVFAAANIPAQAIGNFIDTSRFRFRERERLSPKFLHNRGLEPHYNVPCTLRAFAIVQEKYPEASLVIAHDGPLRTNLNEMARDLGLRNVTFCGSISQNAMRDLYNEADIYLTSPDMDNMPLSVFECYASGLPLVSTSVGGVPCIVKHEATGLLVPVNDHVALANAAVRLLSEPGLAMRLARNGLAECRKYEGAVLASEWVALYRELSCRVHA
jgi:glycosyltransferase involved in cell wall biosynthesis